MGSLGIGGMMEALGELFWCEECGNGQPCLTCGAPVCFCFGTWPGVCDTSCFVAFSHAEDIPLEDVGRALGGYVPVNSPEGRRAVVRLENGQDIR